MKESKGWEFLTAFEEIDEKYIYQAAKPWKENKIVIVQHYIRGVAACILLVAVILALVLFIRKRWKQPGIK